MTGHDSVGTKCDLPSTLQPRRIQTHSAEETAALGGRLGALLLPGDTVLLSGELGAGKTCLTQGIARGLGIDAPVCSPTFVLVGEYEGRAHLYHADLYRLENAAEVADLDLVRSTEDGVLVVEWPERAPAYLPRDHLLITIAHDGEEMRWLEVAPTGPRAQEIAAALLEDPAARAGL